MRMIQGTDCYWQHSPIVKASSSPFLHWGRSLRREFHGGSNKGQRPHKDIIRQKTFSDTGPGKQYASIILIPEGYSAIRSPRFMWSLFVFHTRKLFRTGSHSKRMQKLLTDEIVLKSA